MRYMSANTIVLFERAISINVVLHSGTSNKIVGTESGCDLIG